MGQAILYCWKCGCVLRAADFERKKAFRVSGQGSCEKCIDDLVAPLSAEERDRVLSGAGEPEEKPASAPNRDTGTRRKTQTSRVPVVTPGTARRRVKGSRDTSAAAMWLILGAGAVIAIVAIAAIGGGRPPSPQVPLQATQPGPPVSDPIPEPVPAPKAPEPRKPPPREESREEAAEKILEQVRGYVRTHPDDFEEQLRRAGEAALAVDGTKAAKELEELRASIEAAHAKRIETDLTAADRDVNTLVGKGAFGDAVDLLEKIQKKHGTKSWSDGVSRAKKRVEQAARGQLASLLAKAVAAKKEGDEPSVRSVFGQVDAWKLPELSAELSEGLSNVPKGTPEPPEARTFRTAWVKAMKRVRSLEFEEAERLLREIASSLKDEGLSEEASQDLLRIRAAGKLHDRAMERLARWPRGRSVRLEYRTPSADVAFVEGVILEKGSDEILILQKNRVENVLLPELTARCRLRLAGMEKDVSAQRASVLLCLTPGEGADARKRLEDSATDVPEKYWDDDASEDAAVRSLFAEAEKKFHRMDTRGTAGPDYRKLLEAGAADPLVRRLRPVIEARLKGLSDHFYSSSDMTGAGSFVRMDYPDLGEAWTSAAEYPPNGGLENHLEFSFTAIPETTYRAWIYAGGCCAETFEFSLQATGLKGPPFEGSSEAVSVEPGANEATPVNAVLRFVRKEHAQHGGPKHPAKWNWIEIPLAKEQKAGTNTVRVVTRQKGFSVAFAVVSADRRMAPRPTETKSRIKREVALLEAAAARRSVAKPAGKILREFWLKVPGSKMPDLTSHPAYPSKPSGREFLTKLEGPTQFAESFGARIRGYLHPPISGLYTFWVCSDDNSEVWLSSDERPEGKRRICSLDGAAEREDWEYQPTTRSKEIPLRAGHRYYIEVIHKEGALEDHVAVGWRLPNGTLERPIPGERLSPPDSRMTGRGAGGEKKEFYRGINLNGQKVTIAGQVWEDGIIGSDMRVTGTPLKKPEVSLDPGTDPDRASMIRSFIYGRQTGTAVLVSSMPAGTYEVYLYLWEDNDPETFDLFVNGSRVRSGYRSGPAGRWERTGPWTVEVSKGSLEVRASSGAAANFSGIEIWRVYR